MLWKTEMQVIKRTHVLCRKFHLAKIEHRNEKINIVITQKEERSPLAQPRSNLGL